MEDSASNPGAEKTHIGVSTSSDASDKDERKKEILKLLFLALMAFIVFNIFNTWPSLYTAIFGTIAIVASARLTEWLSVRAERYPLKNRPVLITGCDTGFGHALATQLGQLGAVVFAGCLHGNGEGAKKLKALKLANLHVLQMDVTKADQVTKSSLEVASKLEGKSLWGLVNNAGLNFVGDVETTNMEQYERVMNINQLGMVRVTKEFLPLIRKAKGRIVNVTSIKGLVSEPLCAAYTMTKFAAEAFSDILRMEMRKFGVTVCIVEPGNYGGITGCLEMNRIHGDISSMWTAMSKELKETYGKAFVDEHVKCAEEAIPGSAQNIQPVINAMIDALYALSPKTRYLIPGGSGWYDHHAFRWRLSRFLPTSFMDSIWLHDLRKWPPPDAVLNDPALRARLH